MFDKEFKLKLKELIAICRNEIANKKDGWGTSTFTLLSGVFETVADYLIDKANKYDHE